jgi:hypothetical protein
MPTQDEFFRDRDRDMPAIAGPTQTSSGGLGGLGGLGPAIANNDGLSENPGAPATAKPKKTTLPVILATNTRPRLRMLTASTTPVIAVRTSNSPGSGPCFGSATSPRHSSVGPSGVTLTGPLCRAGRAAAAAAQTAGLARVAGGRRSLAT